MTDTSNHVSDNTVVIEIDGREIKVEKGSMIIAAADREGIKIPRFCYHKKLSIAANCRMCMVDVEKAPKPLPACATPVMDGMKVYTQSKRAIDAQRNVMEFLLINHPLDCPICDQGGECELQDVSMGYGRDVSRYVDSKRVVEDENLGSLIATDMTRCILCTRCVRFLNEIAGTDELGGIGRGDRTNISTAVGKAVASEMSGNVIDLCPVGALTNKPFRYKARAWELMATAAISMHDGVGSNLYYHTRNGRILRTVPQDNDALNEAWLSDRDRYAIHGLNHEADRITQPMVKENGQWHEISWEEALGKLVNQIKKYDGDDIALYTSNYATTEEYLLLKQLFDQLGSKQHEHRINITDFSDADRLPRVDVPLERVNQAQKIVLVGGYIRHEQPILNHKIRQAWLAGAEVSSFGPQAFDQNYDLLHDFTGTQVNWVKQLASLAKCVADIKQRYPEGALGEWVKAQKTDEDINHLAKQLLKDGVQGLFVVGQISQAHPQANMIKAITAWLAQATGGQVNELSAGANASGAHLAGLHATGDIKQNEHRLNLVYQAELSDFADQAAIKNTLTNSDFTVVFNAFCDVNMKSRADLILPIALLPECTGSMVNNYGHRQTSTVAHKSPGDTKPGWRVLRVLGNLLELDHFDYQDINEVMAITEKFQGHQPVIKQDCEVHELVVKGLALFARQGIYDGDPLCRRSQPLQDSPLATSDAVYVNPKDLLSIGFAAGDLVSVEQNGRYAELTLAVTDEVPEGSAVVNLGRHSTAMLNATELNVAIIGVQS
ncbi:NADH-quinone oxidoreductase subunit NuoG [Marinicella meishanensis]|uniref:NADH-quinone oxidoreductase subunit NuoG n=1 Tax=Marinicella meishanensis TaxID=2873263 RepID=UPI001CBADEED|nr:NADH-quinone oxidoreductase subunit NuoG [Marinicella sp. NBU2979]